MDHITDQSNLRCHVLSPTHIHSCLLDLASKPGLNVNFSAAYACLSEHFGIFLTPSSMLKCKSESSVCGSVRVQI